MALPANGFALPAPITSRCISAKSSAQPCFEERFDMQLCLTLLKRIAVLALLSVSSLFAANVNPLKPHPKTPEQLRAEYIARLQEQYVPPGDESTVGSLWSAQSPLGDFSVDYK